MSNEPRSQDEPTAAPARASWAYPVEAVLEALGVEASAGLSEEEALARLERFGPNRLRRIARRHAGRILWDQLASPVVALLAAASALAWAFGERLEAAAVGVVLVLNTAIGFATERRAVRSMEALRQLSRSRASVRRDGRPHRVPADTLVPGDLVLLEAGDVATADLRLVQASRLEVNEAVLTGESLPVAKQVEPVVRDSALGDRHCMIYKGTAISRGSGEGVVVATGMHSELGHISRLVAEATPETTPLEARLETLARRLVAFTLGIAVLVALSGLAAGRALFLSIELALALAVAAVPEGLPIVATMALARGMWRMARRRALIERLSAVETLGSTSVLLTDKTGTLTENRMVVAELVTTDGSRLLFDAATGGPDARPESRRILGCTAADAGGAADAGRAADVDAPGDAAPRAPIGARAGDRPADGDEARPDAVPRPTAAGLAALEVAALCTNAALPQPGESSGHGDPTELALLEAARAAGLEREALLARWPEVEELAFDSVAKRMATLHREDDGLFAAVKGAPESLLPDCSEQRSADGSSRPLDGPERAAWLARAAELAGRGHRVLALAARRVGTRAGFGFESLELLGLVALVDPPRVAVREAIAACRRAGIRVVMVTGDHAGTAWHVAEAVGLVRHAEADAPPNAQAEAPRDGPIDARAWPSLTALPDAVARSLREAPVLARATPQQKLELIALHQRAGAVVAMIGDGVNDAPALRKADIGIAMGVAGTQVAREAADVVLLDDEVGSVVAAVEEGRAIFENLRKFVVYLMSCNVSEILIVAGSSFLPGPLPLLPLQILFLNLVTDVFPALALGVGEGPAGLALVPPRDAREPLLTRSHWRRIAGFGLAIAFSVLLAHGIAHHGLGVPEPETTSISFLTLALAQLWHVFDLRAARSPWLRNEITRNPWIWGAIALCLALLGLALHVPALATILGLTPPGAPGWALAVGASLLPLAIGQLDLLRRRRGATLRAPTTPPEFAAA